MSDPFEFDSDGLDFNDRTTRDSFNERLLRAKEDSEKDLDSRIDFNDFYTSDDTDALNEQLKQLQKQVVHMESQAEKLEAKLIKRRERRVKEASLTNLSPEARADFVAQQESDIKEGDTPDLDVIFEYLLLLGSTPGDDTNDLSTNDFLKPHAGIRKKALESTLVKRQERYSNLCFTEANNILESNAHAEGEIRHCELKGKAHNEDFTLAFDVLEPSMIMSNLMYEVDIEMNMAIGDILEKVQEECNLLAFFRLIIHYGLLVKEREDIFERLQSKYKGTEVNVEELSKSRLKFEGGADCEAYFILEWKAKAININRYRLDANVTDHVQPDISFEAVRPKSVNDRDTEFRLAMVNDKFLDLVKIQGVYTATETIINKVLMP